MSLRPRAVVVHRRSEYDEMVMRHSTHQHAAFFLEGRGRTINELVARHGVGEEALTQVGAAIPADWRRADVERSDLHRFAFAAEDIVLVVGQDGLVANVAKYLSGQPVIGINPDPVRNPGVLVQHPAESTTALLASVESGNCTFERRTMVTATADDGQKLHAVNEVYFGHRSHQSARYRIELPDGSSEHHSSSGLLAGTGTGSTGWLRSVWEERGHPLTLPTPTAPDLCWFAREAWPSAATGTSLTAGAIPAGSSLRVRAESDELVCFGDGIESDSLRVTWGQTLVITTASQTLNLVTT